MKPMRLNLALIRKMCIAAFACMGLVYSYANCAEQGTANPEKRIALVIGNSSYRFSPLKNPVNDARAVSASLRALGFTVTVRENTNLQALIDAMRNFWLESKHSDVRLVFYAGHGVQVRGKNYLVPVDTDLLSEEEVPAKSADLTGLLERLGELESGVNIVILDACRTNPFANLTIAAADGRALKTRGAARLGLAQVSAPQGTLVAFSTAPGSTAIDSGKAPNSLYTKHLLANLSMPGLPLEQMFKRVRIGVAQETKRAQVPWENSSLMGDFCFKTLPGSKCGETEYSLVDPSKIR